MSMCWQADNAMKSKLTPQSAQKLSDNIERLSNDQVIIIPNFKHVVACLSSQVVIISLNFAQFCSPHMICSASKSDSWYLQCSKKLSTVWKIPLNIPNTPKCDHLTPSTLSTLPSPSTIWTLSTLCETRRSSRTTRTTWATAAQMQWALPRKQWLREALAASFLFQALTPTAGPR